MIMYICLTSQLGTNSIFERRNFEIIFTYYILYGVRCEELYVDIDDMFALVTAVSLYRKLVKRDILNMFTSISKIWYLYSLRTVAVMFDLKWLLIFCQDSGYKCNAPFSSHAIHCWVFLENISLEISYNPSCNSNGILSDLSMVTHQVQHVRKGPQAKNMTLPRIKLTRGSRLHHDGRVSCMPTSSSLGRSSPLD